MAEGLAKLRKKRIAYVDTERGTDFYAQAVQARRVHPEAFDFDAIYSKSIAEISRDIYALDPKEYGVVVVDSVSHLWQAAMDAYEGKKTSQDGIPAHAWGRLKKPYKDLINFLIGSPFDVFILGRQKNVFDEDADGKMTKVGVAMRAEGETPYEPHICLRMESQQNPDDTTQSRVALFAEKDRTGILQGQWFYNPDFTTIAPILPFLGETQAPAEDEDERIAKDGELLDKQEAKARDKEAKSAGLLTELQGKIAACTNLESLSAVAVEVTKAKRYMTDVHIGVLRELHANRRDQIVKDQAGNV